MSDNTNNIGIIEEPVYMVFPPSQKSMKEEYPELEAYEEFKGLSSNDLKFAWYYAVFFRNQPDLKRCESAYKYSWSSFKNQRKDVLVNGFDKFPPDIRTAIKKFESFDVPMRAKALNMVDHMVAQIEEIVYARPTDDDARDKYVRNIKSIREMLPELIKDKESGFGIKVTAPKELLKVMGSALDLWQGKKAEAHQHD